MISEPSLVVAVLYMNDTAKQYTCHEVQQGEMSLTMRTGTSFVSIPTKNIKAWELLRVPQIETKEPDDEAPPVEGQSEDQGGTQQEEDNTEKEKA